MPGPAILASVAAVLVAQDGLTGDLKESQLSSLLTAVEAGTGLVSLDGMLNTAADGYRAAVGVNLTPAPRRAAATQLRIVAETGFVTQERPQPEVVWCRRPLRIIELGLRPNAVVYVSDDQDRPVMWSVRHGAGRVVQWSVSPLVWGQDTIGFGFGLDDLLWRAIAWAARKPFATMPLPPYTRLRFDDCQGLWRNAEDFAFVDVLNAHGHVPSLFVCLSSITDSGAARMRQLVAAGRAEFSPHVIRPDVGLYLGDATHTYTKGEIQSNFREIDSHFSRWGIPIAPVIADHNHEYSTLAVPEFARRGMRYRINVTAPDEHWFDEHRDWHPSPYDLTSYAIDEIPGTGIVAVLNHFSPFMFARTQTGPNAFMFDRDGSFGDVIWDFLNGLAGDGGRFDVESSVARFALHERRAIQSGFVGGSISHSHWMRFLTAAQLDDLLTRVDHENRGVERRPTTASESAQRADDHRRSRLAQVRISGNAVSARILGDPTIVPELRIYRDTADGQTTSAWFMPEAHRDNRGITARVSLDVQ